MRLAFVEYGYDGQLKPSEPDPASAVLEELIFREGVSREGAAMRAKGG